MPPTVACHDFERPEFTEELDNKSTYLTDLIFGIFCHNNKIFRDEKVILFVILEDVQYNLHGINVCRDILHILYSV